ncbi:uncharacterized protein LOC108467991 [Gossypium arboreum]|uniref:Large ribosomal subunit protein bL32m n=1 Tax=Gossypium arboreum TaxID=29729 RepID=A0ABR0P8Z3_GOSAR|nr:uncharacterized protein LOC108467991 [Gossypium arboreum]KAK5817676.1 hypothetical protein PVK06_022604 [Gossypium arboreum]
MASRLAMLKHSAATDYGSFLGLRRCIHASALPPPLGAPIGHPPPSQSLVFPESDQTPESNNNSNIGFGFGFGFGFPSFPLGGGSMELMAVPKKKVSRHKRGIRNGPKALKPIPVIIRCKSCGRVKLPHFFCCSGDRGHNNERDDSSG